MDVLDSYNKYNNLISELEMFFLSKQNIESFMKIPKIVVPSAPNLNIPVQNQLNQLPNLLTPVQFISPLINSNQLSAHHHQHSPLQHPHSPLHHQPSPLQYPHSPLHHQHSPLHHSHSPLHHKHSPLHHTHSPLHHQKQPQNKPLKIQNNFYFPKETDSLFWCFFILVNGEIEYEMIKSLQSQFKNEKQEKIKYVESIKLNTKLLKQNKIKLLGEIENELTNENVITIQTIIALSVLKNVNILYICNNVYFEKINNTDIIPKNYFIIHKKNNIYGFEVEVTEEKIKKYKDNLLQVESINKPLKSISGYKLNELIDICNKLNISLITKTGEIKQPKMNKQSIYNLIVSKL